MKYLVITHTFATGPTQEMRDYLIKQKSDFAFIEHPFSFNKNQDRSYMSFYEKGEKVKSLKSIKVKGHDLIYFIKDFFYTIYFVIKGRKKFDVCVAADNLNALASLILKKFGYFKKVIYWTIDYTPKRFENKTLDKIYHGIDRFCCYKSDLLWNSSMRMKEARKENGVNISKCADEYIMHDGCHFNEITRFSDEKIDRFKLVFMGHLIKDKGVDLIIDAMPKLLKEFPQISLTIIGTGDFEGNLKEQAKKLRIDDKIIFTGFVKSHKEVEKIIASCGIGIAPYKPFENSFSFFSDVGKVKVYLACGVPVLITDVPEVAKHIDQKKAGTLFEYDTESLIEKTKEFLTNEEKYFDYRKNAIEFAEAIDWKIIFNNALKSI